MKSTSTKPFRVKGLLILTIALAVMLPAQAAAGDAPRTTCGIALLKLEADFTQRALALAPLLCKRPALFNNLAVPLVVMTNRIISRFNTTYASRDCDPDVLLPLAAKNTADVMLVLQDDLGATPLDRFCNNLDDPNTLCGNGQEGPGEACDGTDLGGQTCETLGNGTGTLQCSSDCLGFNLQLCSGPAYCGNNVTDANESCDTGGQSSTCDSDCTLSLCGDGQTNPAAGEQCDDGNSISGDGCSNTCNFD